jgi:hypothetical protein
MLEPDTKEPDKWHDNLQDDVDEVKKNKKRSLADILKQVPLVAGIYDTLCMQWPCSVCTGVVHNHTCGSSCGEKGVVRGAAPCLCRVQWHPRLALSPPLHTVPCPAGTGTRTCSTQCVRTLVWLLTHGTSVDIHKVVEEDEVLAAIHAHAEVFDPMAESAFQYLQVRV